MAPMELSRRILSIQPSPTVALNAKATALSKQGAKVLNFAVGEPDFPTPAPIIECAIAAMRNGRTKYGPAGGGLELRQIIVQKLKRDNRLSFLPEQIVAGIGAKEILFHSFLSILNDGDEVIVPAPYWVSYADQFKAAGATAVTLPLPQFQSGKAFKAIDIAEMEKAATKKTKAVVLNSPNNPAGYVMKRDELEELGKYLLTKDWYIVSDEIYEYMAFDAPHISLLEMFPELAPRFIYINGMSKGFAMTGWRVGYAAGPSPVMQLVRGLQSHSSTCIPGFIEDAATLALKEGRSLMAPEIEILRKRRDHIVGLIETQLPDVGYMRPEGAFYVFLDVRKLLQNASNLSERTSLALCDRLLSEYHIAVVPGEAFGAPGFMRMSYATGQETIGLGIDRLQKAFSEI